MLREPKSPLLIALWMNEAHCGVMFFYVHSLEGPMWAARQDVARSVLASVANGARGRGGRVFAVSIRHFPAVGKFAVPQSAPPGFENVEFGFVLDFGGCPEFVAGVWELVWSVFSPSGGIDAFEWVLS